jgi:hypothetical protein
MACRILAQLAGFAPAREAGAGSKMRMQNVHHAEPKWAVVFRKAVKSLPVFIHQICIRKSHDYRF